MWLWVKHNDVLCIFYGLWLAALTILEFGWPWQW
jgi:hypothetical protein